MPGDHGAVAGEIFVDTSAWYPLAVRRDPAHRLLAKALRERIHEGAAVITTNLIVAETHALLVRVRSTAELEAAALTDWLERYADQEFSFTDAVSFAVMTEWAITDALTLDRHFAIAGFRMEP